MKSVVYILQFEKTKRYYIGSTNNLARRLEQHRSGHTHTTRRMGEFLLVFSQEVDSLKVARTAERRIKSWKRKDFIERIIADNKISFLDNEE